MIGKIKINNLAFECVIGVFEDERNKPQKVVVNVEVGVDFTDLKDEKNTGKTLDWAFLSEQVERHLIQQKYYLTEEAVKGLAEMILIEEKAVNTKVSLKKKFCFKGKLDSFEAEIYLEKKLV